METEQLILLLLVVQAVLLLVLLVVMLTLQNRLGATGQKVDQLVGHVDRLVTDDLRATLGEARRAVQRIDELAETASGTLLAAEPVVKAVSNVARVFQKPTTPLWIDAIRLAFGVFGVVREKRSEKQKALPAEEAAEKEDEYVR